MSSSTSKTTMDLALINERFAVGRKLGSGSFGEIYIAFDRLRGIDVAVKVESMHTKHPQIMYEAKIYRALTGGKGIPLLHWYGTAGNYNVLVMELLGPSLEDLFCHMRRKFNLKTVLMVADQMLDRLELLHSKHYIHRDIKPDNFVVKGDMVYLIDFGLAKRFRDPKTLEHIPMKTGKNLTGTARYVSISTHMGVEPSRRDDLESLCYVWLYFLRGSLPWQGQRGSKRTKYAKIMGLKIDTQPEELVDVVPNLKKKMAGPARNNFQVEYDSNSSTAASEHENYWIVTQQVFPHQLPQEFKYYLQYCRNLRFDETPDYVYLRRLLKDVFYREGFQYDRVFDWGVAPPKKFNYSPSRNNLAVVDHR